MKAQKLVLGNITTLDDNKPLAKAMTIVDGRIQYVGDIEFAKSLCDDNTVVLDYGNNYIYPGFMDGHVHGMFAGYRSLGQANVTYVLPASFDGYRQVIEKFINEHPEKEFYLVNGWGEDGVTVFTSQFLDSICSDKPLILNTVGGHSILLNSKGMEVFNIDKASVEKYGDDLVRVDENGNPTGYLCETPAIEILQSLKITIEEAKDYILDWQNFAFSNGFTACADTGIELMSKNALDAYIELNNENRLKLYSYGYMMCDDNLDNPADKAKQIANMARENNAGHFKIIGAKVFLDGVVEAHTAWLDQEYSDKPGYFGKSRFNDLDKLAELVAETGKLGLSVHAHSDGDGATKFFLDAIEAGQAISKNLDQRNAAAHLQLVAPEDFKRMADTNTVAVVPPLWVPKIPGMYEQECKYIGKQRNDSVYPIKSFLDAGATIVFHSDYPISPTFNGPKNIYSAVTRTMQNGVMPGANSQYCLRGKDECIDRLQSLKALTSNVAYMIHEEDNLGTITQGKIGNLTILDKDILNDNIEDITGAKVIATVVDGDEVYHS